MRFETAAKEDAQQWQKSYTRLKSKPEKRSWLHIDMHGISQDLEVAKHVIMRRAHLLARDLRLLDPLLSYPSSILGREHAIVVNLEHIKTIITAREVFLLDSHNPIVAPFVQELRLRLPSNHSNQPSTDGAGCDHNNPECTHHPEDREGSDTTTSRESSLLPFEFQALEACLEAACHRLDSEASTLAKEAHNALDALTSHVSASNLETVRQIKNQLVLIFGRVQRVRDEIEHLLDDDGDMAEMYLTDKLLREQREGSPASNISETRSQSSLHGEGTTTGSSYPEVTLEDTLKSRQDANPQGHSPASISRQPSRHSPTRSPSRNEEHPKLKDRGSKREHLKLVTFHMDNTNQDTFRSPPQSRTSSMSRVTGASTSKRRDVEELECLLEAYFVLVDGIINHVASLLRWNRKWQRRPSYEELPQVKEYVDDTEDYVKIMLDDHQNNLLKLNVMLTVSCLVISIFISVTGIFGMNIEIPLFKEGKPQDFWSIVGWGSGASVVLLALIMGWCKYKGFL